ncbi:morphogenic membrane protein MmpA [Streptomyces venetus]
MTTHRATKPVASPTQTVERAVTIGLILAVLAGLAWIAGMIYTIAEWPL